MPYGWSGRGVYIAALRTWGATPTFGNDSLSVEVHLLDFEGDLYGARLGVGFVARIRDERKFASVDELAAQIACDVQQARCLHAR